MPTILEHRVDGATEERGRRGVHRISSKPTAMRAASATPAGRTFSMTTYVDSAVAHYRGQLVKSTGDGILATFFDGPGRAIQLCQDDCHELLEGVDLRIHAGIHTGQIERRRGDIGGIAVNIAARVMSAAFDGEIWVTGTVPSLVVGSDHQFSDRGNHELRASRGPGHSLPPTDRRWKIAAGRVEQLDGTAMTGRHHVGRDVIRQRSGRQQAWRSAVRERNGPDPGSATWRTCRAVLRLPARPLTPDRRRRRGTQRDIPRATLIDKSAFVAPETEEAVPVTCTSSVSYDSRRSLRCCVATT